MLGCFVDMLEIGSSKLKQANLSNLNQHQPFPSGYSNVSVMEKDSWCRYGLVVHVFKLPPTLTLRAKSVVHVVRFLARYLRIVDAVCY
jgi:hypothetical protein